MRRLLSWLLSLALVPCALLPVRWCWPFAGLAASLLLRRPQEPLRAVLRSTGVMIIGAPALLVFRSWLDPPAWLPWIAVLAVIAAGRRRLGSGRLTRGVAVAAAWAAAAWIIGGPWSFPPGNAPAAPRAVLVCAGDSLTAGVEPGTDAHTYVARLRATLGCTVINAGRASDRVADLLARFDRDVARHHPTVTLIFIGGNDYMDGTPRADFACDLDRVVGRAAAISRVIVVETPTGIVWNPYAGVYRTVARRHGADLVPESWLRWWFTCELLAGGWGGPRLTLDGIHLSPAGAARVAAWLAPPVRAALRSAGPGR